MFPNYDSSWHRRDKLSQYYLLQAAGVPMPKTWIFYDQQMAREWALQADFPKVFKLSTGGGGRGVALVSSAGQACGLIGRMFAFGLSSKQIDRLSTTGMSHKFQHLRALASRCKAAARYVIQEQPPSSPVEKGYVYFQDFVPGNNYKTGIIVIGDRAFGFQNHNAPGDFRSSGGNPPCDSSPINLNCVQMAFDITNRLGFPMMSYDFLLHQGNPVVLEMNFNDGKACGYWTRNLEWVNKPMSRQEAQVEVFLNEIGSGNGKVVTTPDRSHADLKGPKTAWSPSLSKVNEETKARDH